MLLVPTEVQASKISPRVAVLKLLAQAGCTNKLVAHYIIDNYNSNNLPTSDVIVRLAGATGYEESSISTWISVVQTYYNG
jgi:hypothetical protein